MSVKFTAQFVFFWLILFGACAAQAQTAGVVTLRANTTSASGSVVPVMTWSTTPVATSCRASGGWSGTKAISGTETLARINATTNYTLTCSWGTGSAQVTWVPPTTNVDGSALTDLAGFRVYYGTSSTSLSKYTLVNDIASRATTISALVPGTWYFMVRVLNSKQVESPNSNVASKAVSGATAAKTVGITITGTPTPLPPTISEVEPNNYLGQAQGIGTAGTTVNGTLSASSDLDWYRVSLPAGKKLTATMAPNSTSDYEMYLYNSAEKGIAWSENGKGVTETVTVTNSGSSAVTYYVRVHYYAGGTGSTNGKYTAKFSW